MKNDNKEIAWKLQTLAREQMKHKLLCDILQDISVCKIEGWDYKNHLIDLKNEIERFLK